MALFLMGAFILVSEQSVKPTIIVIGLAVIFLVAGLKFSNKVNLNLALALLAVTVLNILYIVIRYQEVG